MTRRRCSIRWGGSKRDAQSASPPSKCTPPYRMCFMGFFVAAKMPEITRKDAMAIGGLHKLKLLETETLLFLDFRIDLFSLAEYLL